MEKMQFFVPVRLALGGDRPVQEMEDVEQALRFLRSWPDHRRGPVYQAALNCCTAAKDGYLTAEEARRSLSSFASITGILEHETPHPAVVSATNKTSRLAS